MNEDKCSFRSCEDCKYYSFFGTTDHRLPCGQCSNGSVWRPKSSDNGEVNEYER